MKPPKPFSLKDRVDEVKTAERFEVDVTDVRSAIKAIVAEKGGEVSISVTKRKDQMTQYLRHVYDEAAKAWDFVDMAHMLATYHTEVIARGIANPDRFAKDATRVGSDVAKIVYPKETASIKRTLPPGESKEVILDRLLSRLTSTTAVPAEDTPKTPPQLTKGSDTEPAVG
jgi:hypothetical protein